MDITTSFTSVPGISPGEAKKWMAGKKSGDFTLLDVRQPAEYRGGHIPGAMLIPLPELPARMRELHRALPVIVYCRSGTRGRSAAALLAASGRTVFNLEGGMLRWNGLAAAGAEERGLELVKGRVTAAQLASLAWALEEGAASFYRAVLETAKGEAVRRMLRTLAAAEEAHKRKVLDAFRSAAGHGPPDAVLSETVQRVFEGGFSIDGAISHLRSGNFGPAETLETAMQLEANSLDLFMKIIRWSGIPDVKTVFSALVEEEKDHLVRLGELLNGTAGSCSFPAGGNAGN